MFKADLSSEQLEWLRKVLLAYGEGRRFFLFGSRVKGESKPSSDLDIAVSGENSTPLPIPGQMIEDFSDSNIPFRADLIDLNSIDGSFKDLSIREAVELKLQGSE